MIARNRMIGAGAPIAGLVGTIYGMTQSFFWIAASPDAPSVSQWFPQMLTDCVAALLVTTMLLAVLALFSCVFTSLRGD